MAFYIEWGDNNSVPHSVVRFLRDRLGRFDIHCHWPILVILFIVFPLAFLYGRYVYAPCDDTYIFLVYVRNFLNGHGLTFNGMVVQGYTSILWVILLSVAGLSHLDLPSLAIALSLLSGLLALIATYSLARKLQMEARWALLPVILLAATGDFTFYMSVGLEQVLFTAFVVGGVVFLYSNEPRNLLRSFHFPAYLVLMVLVRPEGVLIASLLLLILGIWGKSLWLMLRCGLILGIMLVPVFIASRIFYGYWLPNTYYVKSNAGLSNLLQGLRYLLAQSWSYLIVLAEAVILVAYCLLKRNYQLLKKVWPVSLIVFVWIAYVALEGGDNLVGGRMLLPIVPLAYVAIIKLMADVKIRMIIAVPGAVLISVELVFSYVSNPFVRIPANNYRQWFETRQQMGIYLHDHYPAGTLVALDPAGIIPYYSQLPTIDMLGLNDVYIAHRGERDYSLIYAHQAGDGAYVLSRKPEIILFGASGASQVPAPYVSDREIWDSPLFQNSYKLVNLSGIGSAYVANGTGP